MSTFRAVPRYPALTTDRSSDFADWLADGAVGVTGTIQQPCRRDKYAYVQPDAFPEKRLYFSYGESRWTVTMAAAPTGRRCVCDVPAQPEWAPDLNPVAVNVSLM